MGLIARVLSFTRVTREGFKMSDVKLDPDGGSNIIGEHFASPGDDSVPLDTDYAAVMGVRRSGGGVVVGYADPINDPEAGPGEVRKYGRDPATGLAVNQVWLKSDSSVLISNALGAIELKADGSVNINGAIISAAGEVTNAAGKVLGTHTHPQGNDSNGDAQVNVGAPV